MIFLKEYVFFEIICFVLLRKRLEVSILECGGEKGDESLLRFFSGVYFIMNRKYYFFLYLSDMLIS